MMHPNTRQFHLPTRARSDKSYQTDVARDARGFSNQEKISNVASTNYDSSQGDVSSFSFSGRDRLKHIELSIIRLIEVSSLAAEEGKWELGLERAKDAVERLELLKSVMKQVRSGLAAPPLGADGEQSIKGRPDNQPMTTGVSLFELTVMVNSNLAGQLRGHGNLSESVEVYTQLCKMASSPSNSTMPSSQQFEARYLLYRFGLNIGNIYFQMQEYQRALKYYRVTLDRLSSSGHKNLKIKLMHNISIAQLAMKQEPDATTALNLLLADNLSQELHQSGSSSQPTVCNANHHAFGLNLMATHYERADMSAMTSTIKALIGADMCQQFRQATTERLEDRLERLIRDKRRQISRSLLMSCNLMLELDSGVRPDTGQTSAAHFCAKLLGTSDTYRGLLSDLQANCVRGMLEKGQSLDKAIAVLRGIGLEQQANLKESSWLTKGVQPTSISSRKIGDAFVASSMVATNLSLVHLLQHQVDKAIECAEQALKMDENNVDALINLANCRYQLGDFQQTESLYKRALSIEPSRWQANYNLVLVNRKLGHGINELETVAKSCLRRDEQHLPLLMYNNMNLSAVQMALMYQTSGRFQQSSAILKDLMVHSRQSPEVYLLASQLVEEDANSLNGTSALTILQQAHREYPYHIPVLERLVAIHISNFNYSDAKALIIDCMKNRPNQVKWHQMLAECYRRAADYNKAIEVYKKAIEIFPQEIGTVRALVKLTDELGLSEEKKIWEAKLNKALRYTNPQA